MNELIVLDLKMPFSPSKDPIYPVLLGDGNGNLVLVDCGCKDQLPELEAVIRSHGREPGQVTHLVLTHHDHDHMGTAAAFKRKYPGVHVVTSLAEEPYVSGKKKSLRLEQAEALQPQLPPERQEFGRAFCALLRSIEPVAVDEIIEGDVFMPWCGGCHLLQTPGHTPGHLALWLPELSTVITGDAMTVQDGKPGPANPQYTLDPPLAAQSLEKLLALKPRRFVCYHGGVIPPSAY